MALLHSSGLGRALLLAALLQLLAPAAASAPSWQDWGSRAVYQARFWHGPGLLPPRPRMGWDHARACSSCLRPSVPARTLPPNHKGTAGEGWVGKCEGPTRCRAPWPGSWGARPHPLAPPVPLRALPQCPASFQGGCGMARGSTLPALTRSSSAWRQVGAGTGHSGACIRQRAPQLGSACAFRAMLATSASEPARRGVGCQRRSRSRTRV